MLILRNGRVLTCADLTVLEDGAVVVDGDRIAWVGNSSEVPTRFLAEGSEQVDLAGATVMPGLIDAHMHISFGEAHSEEELQLYTPTAYRAVRAAVDAEKVLLAGVTTACDPGGPRGIALAVRDAVDAGLVQGPRLSVAGRQMSSPQGIGDTMPRWLGPLESSFGVLVRSPEEIRQEIRDDVKDGVDLIKVAGSGPGTREYAAFTVEEVSAAVQEAHRLERPLTIHARSRQSVSGAVDAGVDWIMHASYMDEATLDRVLEQKIPLLPALTMLVNSLEAGTDVMSPAALDGMKHELDAAVNILSKARATGATLIAGSESGFGMTPYGEWHAREMSLFVELLGMSHHEALLCMTRNAAYACPRQRADVGILEPGRYADLLVIDGRPDEDVRLLQDRGRISQIYKAGRPVRAWRPPEEPRRRMPFETNRRYVNRPFVSDQHRSNAGDGR